MEEVVAPRPESEQCVRDRFGDVASGIWWDKTICVL